MQPKHKDGETWLFCNGTFISKRHIIDFAWANAHVLVTMAMINKNAEHLRTRLVLLVLVQSQESNIGNFANLKTAMEDEWGR